MSQNEPAICDILSSCKSIKRSSLHGLGRFYYAVYYWSLWVWMIRLHAQGTGSVDHQSISYLTTPAKCPANKPDVLPPHRAGQAGAELWGYVMPMKAARFCAKCNRLAVSGGLCEIHAIQRQQQVQDRRDNKWLYLYKSARWQALRDAQLRKEPLCAECRKQNRLTPADTADHIKPHHGNPDLFYDADNLQSMCSSCHSRKTASEDGGYGNLKRH